MKLSLLNLTNFTALDNTIIFLLKSNFKICFVCLRKQVKPEKLCQGSHVMFKFLQMLYEQKKINF